MTLTKVDVSEVRKHFTAKASAKVTLFGLIKLGEVNGSYEVKTVDVDSSSSSITVTFGPTVISGTIPLEQQVAYIVGGVPSYPPAIV